MGEDVTDWLEESDDETEEDSADSEEEWHQLKDSHS